MERDNGDMSDRRLPPGHQPYDFANGIRVGGIAGALIGGGVFALTGWPLAILIGAVLGGVVGFLWQRREMRSS